MSEAKRFHKYIYTYTVLDAETGLEVVHRTVFFKASVDPAELVAVSIDINNVASGDAHSILTSRTVAVAGVTPCLNYLALAELEAGK